MAQAAVPRLLFHHLCPTNAAWRIVLGAASQTVTSQQRKTRRAYPAVHSHAAL